jgi:hypothetical protein
MATFVLKVFNFHKIYCSKYYLDAKRSVVQSNDAQQTVVVARLQADVVASTTMQRVIYVQMTAVSMRQM